MPDTDGLGTLTPGALAKEPEVSRALREVHLRLLMKERDDLSARLTELDNSIWELEERFRVGR